MVWQDNDATGTATSIVVSTAAKAAIRPHPACTVCYMRLGPVWIHLLCAAGCGQSIILTPAAAAERAGVMQCARSCPLPLPAAIAPLTYSV